MEPFNVKIRTFPDLSRQVRIYNRPIFPTGHYPPEKVKSPFDGSIGIVIHDKTIQDHYDRIADESVKRTKSKIYDYAKCNVWDYFVTFTFSKDKVDRYDYDVCAGKLSKWLNNLRRSSPTLSYLVVPERHKDGAWHFHGLFAGLNPSHIVWTGKYVIKRKKRLSEPSGASRIRFVRTDRKIYKFGNYRLGWMTATEVQDQSRVAGYIVKYITKDMCSVTFRKKRYWASRNLLVPLEETVYLDPTNKFILQRELEDESGFVSYSERRIGEFVQGVRIIEVQ